MLKLLEIGLSSPECVKIVCKVCESVWKSVWECMKLRILNVLTKTAPTIPQTPHTDLKYPYVPKMAIWTHCAMLVVDLYNLWNYGYNQEDKLDNINHIQLIWWFR